MEIYSEFFLTYPVRRQTDEGVSNHYPGQPVVDVARGQVAVH